MNHFVETFRKHFFISGVISFRIRTLFSVQYGSGEKPRSGVDQKALCLAIVAFHIPRDVVDVL